MRERSNFDLILMDIQMPIMDGHTAIREIRAWEQAHNAPPTPVVTLTAHALCGAHAESLAAGADAHLTKPGGTQRSGRGDRPSGQAAFRPVRRTAST